MIAALVLAAVPSLLPWPHTVHFEEGAGWKAAPLQTHVYVHRDRQLGDEGYVLKVGPNGASAWANTHAGLFYAAQTYAQLAAQPAGRRRPVQIRDWPEYRWRGMHLDVARHFFDVATVERYIDVAAHYKLNVFHWHLTDDQSWRLTVPGYPSLTLDSYAYSDAQIRRIVQYAAQRYVTVVPEVELAAHAQAAIAAYPRFGCGSDVFCENAGSFAFFRDVLTHVFTLFPGPYVHIGGDEVPAGFSESTLTAQLEPFIRSHGRTLVGWSEILTPTLSKHAVVLAWNSMRRAAEAALRGNRTVTTGWPLYFDAAQGDAMQEPRATVHMSTLAQVYSWDVTPPGLSDNAKPNVLGGEAALWTERIRTPAHLFYMLLPRELALAELLWTPRSEKNWIRFMHQLPAQFDWLADRGYSFRIPNTAISVEGARYTQVAGSVQTLNAWVAGARAHVAFSAPVDGEIRYTLNGSVPTAASNRYVHTLTVSLAHAVDVRAVAYFRGRHGAVTECRIRSVSSGSLPRSGYARSWEALVSP